MSADERVLVVVARQNWRSCLACSSTVPSLMPKYPAGCSLATTGLSPRRACLWRARSGAVSRYAVAVIDPARDLKSGCCPDCSAKPTLAEIASARLVCHVPFTGDRRKMIPAWEVATAGGRRYYCHAGAGEPLDW